MKKKLLLILLFFSFFFTNAQNLITLQHNGFSTFHRNLDTAISKSIDGDSIYLPGGSFSIGSPLKKQLHIIGVGHHPDSTNATARTIISNLQLDSGSDNGSITGVYLSGSIVTIGNVNGYSITRCNIIGGVGFGSTHSNYFLIKENIIGFYSYCFACDFYSVYGSNAGSNHLLSNNIFRSKVGVLSSTIKNNVFLSYNSNAYYPSPLNSSVNCLVENNVFNVASGGSNCIFRNNLNGGVNGVDGFGNQGSGNFLNGVLIDSVFLNSNSVNWNYSYDYHLRLNSPYKNAGIDGTDLGIYGGVFPWKAGSVPFNPHIQSKVIAPKTNSSGTLPVNIKVKSQDN